jgi:hypothetical protein
VYRQLCKVGLGERRKRPILLPGKGFPRFEQIVPGAVKLP